MPRKKREPIELIEENLEDLAAENAEENLEEELEVLEADAEDDNEEVTAVEAITDEEEDTVVTEKPKRKRAPRKKRPEVEAAAEEVEEVPAVEAPSREKAPAPVTPAFDPKEDPMIRQWEMIRQISESICSSLEKASAQIKEMPAQTAAAFQENFRAPVARPAPITKIAVAAALLALVVSVLSLSFAQSARQSVLAKETISQPVAPVAYAKPEPKVEALPPVKLTNAAPEIARVNPTAPPKKAVLPLVAKKHAAAKKVH